MKYIDEYRDKGIMLHVLKNLQKLDRRNYTFMEVCGGHTMSVHRFGIHSLLPCNFRLISGPGCPVCVTSKIYIDKAVEYAQIKDTIIVTYGDLIRVPGSISTLEKEKAKGADIRIVLSSFDSLNIARSNPLKKVIFLGIGFETTAPGTAVTIKEAKKLDIKNFYLLSAHKVMPPAMDTIIRNGTKLDGFICPGHVSAITGSNIFEFIPRQYGLGCVVTGFEPVDILQAIYMLALQVDQKKPSVEIQYRRAVTREGNLIAQKYMNDVFSLTDDWWRGFGTIPLSGLKICDEFLSFDAEKFIPVSVDNPTEDKACICGEILRGIKTPLDCKLFANGCEPANPIGACMVSTEGTCQAHYKYKSHA